MLKDESLSMSPPAATLCTLLLLSPLRKGCAVWWGLSLAEGLAVIAMLPQAPHSIDNIYTAQ